MDPFISSESRYSRRTTKKTWRSVVGVLVLVFGVVAGLLYLLAVDAPRAAFPQVISIAPGSSVRTATNAVKRYEIVRSRQLLELYITVVMGGKVVSGDYMFEHPTTLAEVARRITSGEYGGSQIRVTIPEGSTNADIARILAISLPHFSTETFERLAKGKEGYLFPDTYFFFPSVTEAEIIQRMQNNFNTQLADLQPELDASKHSLAEIITMASLIEREAGADPTEQAMISGILWARIQKGMLLQVDAPFWYLLGKGSSELTVSDLRIDSRYNTYRYKGLPPAPIGNPGMAAITAALHPVESNYLFYLHGDDGIVRYATTFNEHVQNKNKYLK